MAKKKRKPNSSKASAAKPTKQKAAKAAPAAPEAAPGSGWAFLLGLAGALGLVTLFLPWFRPGGNAVYGYQILTSFDQVPAPVQAGFQRVNGALYMTLIIITALTATVLGFSWGRLAEKMRHWGGNISAVLAFGALLEGMILLLVLLNMKAQPHADWTGTLASLTLFAIGGLGLLLAAAVDRSEGHTEGALPTSDWAIWLGSLSVTAIFHYQFVCYELVQKAPEALMTKLRTFR